MLGILKTPLGVSNIIFLIRTKSRN